MMIIKTKEEIEIIRQGGKILADILNKLGAMVRPGVSTGDLEAEAARLIEEAGGRPSFLGYPSAGKPFPTALCTSVNDEVVHTPALPSRILKEGDIIGIDIGMEYPFNKNERGYYTDMAATFPVGQIKLEAQKLIRTTKESLDLAIDQIRPGNNLNHIARAIETHVKKNGFSVVRDLVGHGVGHEVHEPPQITNFVFPGNENIVLEPGMVLAIEPMVNLGRHDVAIGRDGISVVTKDGSLSAHFEHTIAVTEEGADVLTEL